ncbi:N-acetylglucosamine-6-phosphate deacetylase [Sinorhizobium meliloti]|nr:N-acetylglucosamine-6-phosphate deacetylase [Sinorhizobium meliloti]MDW9695555.1 N-acetylglucosamine-6-phosphate deacetylase [Sinorhizobium meliloti]MDW9720421.1 N-acetylglucosamine-6-phosphate deacetylase [Sinorhizobium meliloti]MDW9757634.1 N-acetylglucosamine-6-phosphate deacetylase [Sinorhizobium meliloti]MDW9986544.1 N-acetylglucosamine-6-phosphate deacetylase [Sinorhizobium meliloti]
MVITPHVRLSDPPTQNDKGAAKMTTQIAIEPLDVCPEMIPVCASWTFGHWDCQAGTTFEETNRLFCDAANGKSSLPLTFVAIADGKPAGMISLRDNDLKERIDLSPWLASLYVHPSHRNKGISSLLIKRLEREAEQLGHKRLYLTTEDSKGLYEKNGWQEIDRVRTPFGDASLMRKDLRRDTRLAPQTKLQVAGCRRFSIAEVSGGRRDERLAPISKRTKANNGVTVTMSTTRIIIGARIFDGDDYQDGADLIVEAGRVKAISPRNAAFREAEIVDASGLLLVPGFIDLQVNGGGGTLFNEEPTLDGIRQICSAHARFGTTALLPTLITDTREVRTAAINAALEAKAAEVPGFLGLHLEGPHISLACKGAHDPALIRPMDKADLDEMLTCITALGCLMVTLAPENATKEQVLALANAGVVVSLGHTDTSFEIACGYAKAGARTVTHLFNAMSGLGHREPGLVGAALAIGTLGVGLIADGFHVDPAAMGIALRAKEGRGQIFLVTDAMSTIGTDITRLHLNGREILRKGGRLTLADGTLAGADIDMLSSVRFVHEKLGLSIAEAIRMATAHPADAMGIANQKGRLIAGADADFLLLTPELQLQSTWIGGLKAFEAPITSGEKPCGRA